MRINKLKWNSEGLPDMLFTADYLNAIYEHCNHNCDGCTLMMPILNNSTNVCLIITQAKMKLAKQVRDIL